MNKIKLQMQLSLDGFIAGPNGEMDWMIWDWDDELKTVVTELTASVQHILLGRVLAEGFIPHWQTEYEKTENRDEGAVKFIETPKTVFSRTLKTSIWKNTKVANGVLRAEIDRLKAECAGDLMVYGGGSFVSSLIREKLIDELYLFINPVAIGEGKTIFADIKETQDFRLVKAQPFDCGIVLMNYRLP